jgi:hypothetical protein
MIPSTDFRQQLKEGKEGKGEREGRTKREGKREEGEKEGGRKEEARKEKGIIFYN